MPPYILCDSCHSPYDVDKNVCVVCGYVKDLKVIGLEIKELERAKKTKQILLFCDKWIARLLIMYKHTIVAMIILAGVVFIIATFQQVGSYDESYFQRILVVIQAAGDKLLYGLVDVIFTLLVDSFEKVIARLIVIIPYLWLTLKGLFGRVWIQIVLTLDMLIRNTTF